MTSLRHTHLLYLLTLSAASRALASGLPDFPDVTPQALYIPENNTGTTKFGSWQQTPTASAPDVPLNWAAVQQIEVSAPYSATVFTPLNMKRWGDVAPSGVNSLLTGPISKGVFSPGESSKMFVGVNGDVISRGVWFASGDTTLYQLDGSAKIVSQNTHVAITLARAEIRGTDGSVISSTSSTHAPSVNLGVPIEAPQNIAFHLFDSGLNGSRLTLSATNSAPQFLIRSWQGTNSTILINTDAPFGTGAVEVVNGINFELKDNVSRILNNNFKAQQKYTSIYGGEVSAPSNIVFKGGGDLTFNGSLTTQYNLGTFTGQGLGLVMSGSGTLILNGANDFGVGVTINSGTLAVGNNAALNGQGPLVLNGGNIQASGGPRTVTPPSIKAKADFAVTGLQDLNLNAPMDLDGGTRKANISAPVVTIGGAISNGGLNKKGTGTLVLSGLSTYTGGTTVEAGVLQLNSGGPTGAIRGTVGVLSSGTLRLNATNSLGYNAGAKVDVINVVGGLIDNVADGDNGWGLTVNLNGATMRSNNGTNSATTLKLYALGGGSAISSIANATSSVISGRIDLREGNPNDRLPINVADGPAADDLVIRAGITESGGSFGITKQGAGTLLLVGGPNDATGSGSTYTGQTVVNGGVLAIDGNNNQSRIPVNNQVIVNNGGAFEVRGITLAPNASAIDVTVNQGGIFRVVSGGSAYIGSQPESHAHIRNVTLNGGTLDLTYSGTLSNWDGESFQLNGNLTVGGTAPSVIQTNAAVNRQGVALNGLRTFQVGDVTNSPAADLTVSAELENSSSTPADDSLHKTGPGTLLLNYANTYSGQTVIDEGTIVLNGSLAGATIANNTGKLTGSGNARAITVNAGGVLAPGVGIGTLSTQSVAFNGGTIELEINSSTLGRDTLAIVGNLTLGASPAILTITDLGSSVIAGGTQLTLLTYTGIWDGQVFSWMGTPLLDDGIFTVGANSFRMDYGDASTKSFSIVTIPEPTSLVSLFAITTICASFRRRQRSLAIRDIS